MEEEEREGEMGVVKMITKTKFSSGGKVAIRLAKYIENGMYNNKIYKVLYYGFRPAEDKDIKEFASYSRSVEGDKPAVRHLIIAPEKWRDERELHYLVLRTMDGWIRSTGNFGIRYVWGLHYNTEHPHAHIGMVSNYPEDLVMGRTGIRRFNRIVEEVFNEKMRGEKRVEKELDEEIKEAEEYEVER